MKPEIHPTYVDAQVVCACGNTFTTRSTKTNIRTDLCNVCHPFYTGEQRIVDTAGQVERFMKRMQSAAETNAGPSKRQARLTTRQEKEAADRRRAEEAEAAAAAARAERRKAQQEQEAALAAQQAAAAAVLSGETDDLKAPVSTETESEHPVAAGAE